MEKSRSFPKKQIKNEKRLLSNKRIPSLINFFNIKEKCAYIRSPVEINDKIKNSINSISFADEIIEEEYQQKSFSNSNFIFLIIHFLFIINLILKVTVTFYSFYFPIMIANIILMFFMAIGAFVYQFGSNFRVKQMTNKIIGYSIILIETTHSIITIAYSLDSIENEMLHYISFYFLLFMTFSIFFFPIEENFLFCIIFVLGNFLIYYCCFFYYLKYTRFYIYEICIFTVLVLLTIYIKRRNCFFIRQSFMQMYKYEKFYFYYEDIINNMNAFLITTDNYKIKFTNKSFNNFFLKHRKKNKIFKEVIDEKSLINFLIRNPNLIQKKFELRDYINLQILTHSDNQEKLNLFLKLLKIEIENFLKNNKQILKIKTGILLNKNYNYSEKGNFWGENLTNQVKLENNFSLLKLPLRYNFSQDRNLEINNKKVYPQKYKKTQTNDIIMNNKMENKNVLDFKFNDDKKSPSYLLEIPDIEKVIFDQDRKEQELKLERNDNYNFKFLLTNEFLDKKYAEFEINFNHMQKIYLENLYPRDLNIINKKNHTENYYNNNINEENFWIKSENNTCKEIGNNSFIEKNDQGVEYENSSETENESNKKILIDLNINLKKRNLLQISEIIENNFHRKNKFYYLGEFKSVSDKNFYQFISEKIQTKKLKMTKTTLKVIVVFQNSK